jgi:hypothetical protein
MSEIQIIKQGKLPDSDGYWANCAYDDTERRLRVSISGETVIRFKQFEVNLADIFETAVLFALRSGQREGEVDVSAGNPAERHLEVIFRGRQDEAGQMTHPRTLSLWLNNQVIEIRQMAEGYEYRSDAQQPWEPGTPPGSTEMQIALLFAKTGETGKRSA